MLTGWLNDEQVESHYGGNKEKAAQAKKEAVEAQRTLAARTTQVRYMFSSARGLALRLNAGSQLLRLLLVPLGNHAARQRHALGERDQQGHCHPPLQRPAS